MSISLKINTYFILYCRIKKEYIIDFNKLSGNYYWKYILKEQ